MTNIFKFLKWLLITWCLKQRTQNIGDIFNTSNPLDCEIAGPHGNAKFIAEGKTDLLIQTPTGWSSVNRVLKTVEFEAWELVIPGFKPLIAADDHIIITVHGEVHMKDLQIGDLVYTVNGPQAVQSIKCLEYKEHMYDLELNDEDHVFYTNGILSHNTTVVAMYILWFSLFNEDKLCIIASKAMNHAVQIMSRIKYAYEELPNWLKAGCKFYNRTSIEFDNGSKIVSEATSENTGRGSSPAILFIDEIAFIPRRIQEELWASITPSLSTGGKFVLTSTPNGDSDLFAQIWRGAKSGQNSFTPIQAMWWQHPDRGEEYYKEMLGKLGPLKVRQELECTHPMTLLNTSKGLMSIEHLFTHLKRAQNCSVIRNTPNG
jgi:hypothetical protein